MEESSFRINDIVGFTEILDQPAKIVITTHPKPDADALGSSLGLKQLLEKLGHDVAVITPTDYPEFLFWMNGNEEVIVYDEAICLPILDEAEIIFCLDFSELKRIDPMGSYIRDTKAIKVLIDHHEDPERFAKFRSWSTKAAATCELIYALVLEMEWENLMDQSIAECLYAGIMTDTGSFKHSNTTKHVHQVVARLIEHGADISKVSRLIYDQNSVERVRLLGFILNERLTIMEDCNAAFIYFSQEDQKRFKPQNGDTEGFVNYALSIKGIRFAAFLSDTGELIKISLRSVGNFAVNRIASEYFEGGGHKNASGGKSTLPLNQTIEKLKQIIIAHKKELNSN